MKNLYCIYFTNASRQNTDFCTHIQEVGSKMSFEKKQYNKVLVLGFFFKF